MGKAWFRCWHAVGMEPEGLFVLVSVWSVVIVVVFVGLLWAAVQDGRDERRSHPR